MADEPLYVEPSVLQQAKNMAARRLVHDPRNAAVLRSFAESCRKLGELDEAAAAYTRLVNIEPDDADASYLTAGLGRHDWPAGRSGVRAAPFVLVRDFLPAEFHDALLDFVSTDREAFAPALLAGKKGPGRYDPGYRDSLDFTGRFEYSARFRSFLEPVVHRTLGSFSLNGVSLARIEMNLRAYRDGHFFKVHMDVPAAGASSAEGAALRGRLISFVYFFHRTPRPFTGGELLLFDTDFDTHRWHRSRFTKITPQDNAIVLFTSSAYHCVVPVRCPTADFADSRFVVNGFVHRQSSSVADAE
jgi:hypothetical protein